MDGWAISPLGFAKEEWRTATAEYNTSRNPRLDRERDEWMDTAAAAFSYMYDIRTHNTNNTKLTRADDSDFSAAFLNPVRNDIVFLHVLYLHPHYVSLIPSLSLRVRKPFRVDVEVENRPKSLDVSGEHPETSSL
ncbi:hypothetical protein O988_00453 [Pseudogymnoascus sp. VKM F-3808]|nr:hypothetical protein O988_00453 [Pseudogymnoascus sp. VKM F-3808]